MANNLLVSYDLHNEKNYQAVQEAIAKLGVAVKIHYSYFYVKSNHTAQTAAEQVWKSMDADDSLFVADATNNFCAWYNISEAAARVLNERWNQ